MVDEISPDKHFQTIAWQRAKIFVDMPEIDAFV